MNIVIRELRANFKSLLIWAVIVLLFVLVGFAKFSAYEANPDLLAILDQMPPALMAAFNFRAFNLTTITGFFGVMYTYFALLLSIAAAMWGTDVITKEERDRTVEFTLTLPVTRARLVTGKVLAILIDCVVLLLITWGSVLFGARSHPTTDSQFYQFVAISMAALFMVQLIFLALGIFLGCALTRYKQASSLVVSILLGTYFLSIFSSLSTKLGFLNYFSPFKYFDPSQLLHESRMDPVFVSLSVVIIVASLVGAYLTYARRDLYI